MRRKKFRIIFISILIFIFFLSAYNVGKKEDTEDFQSEQNQAEINVDDLEDEVVIEEPDIVTEEPDAVTEEPDAVTEEPVEIIEESSVSDEVLEIPNDEDLVLISDYIPSIYVDLKYATEDNFTGIVIYDFIDPYLRYGTVKKLAAVQEELLAQGYSLKIWDAYRPVSAQFVLWEVYPDSTYVANPNTGNSSHSKGNTVDVTLVYADGTELLMPTEFDDFSSLADRDYSDISDEATANVMILENTMYNNGFTGYSKEWWHYSDSTSYPVIYD